MTTLYKWTKSNGRTYDYTQWKKGKTHKARPNISKPLCSEYWIHAYQSIVLAVLFDCWHANYRHNLLHGNGLLWLAKGHVSKSDGIKIGTKKCTLVKLIEEPRFTCKQILAAVLSVFSLRDLPDYASQPIRQWLEGKERNNNQNLMAAIERLQRTSRYCIVAHSIHDCLKFAERMSKPEILRPAREAIYLSVKRAGTNAGLDLKYCKQIAETIDTAVKKEGALTGGPTEWPTL